MDASLLRHLTAEVDDEHRTAMRTMREEVGDMLLVPAARARRSRRALLTGLGIVSGGAISAAMASRAAAADSTTTTGAPATTTTAPPKLGTANDLTLLGWAQSLELAAVDAYGIAIASGKLSPNIAAVAGVFQRHHREHAQALGGLASKSAPGVSNKAILAAFGPKFTAATTEQELVTLAMTVENAAASTYQALIASLTATDPAALVASILPIEARHAVVLGQASGAATAVYLPVRENADGAGLDPTKYPIEG